MIKNLPVIGITTYHRDEKGHFRLPSEYAEAVRRAGGLPLLLQPGEPHLDALLDLLDGLIFSGGGDVDPTRYTNDTHAQVYAVSQERDDFEFALIERALARQMPLMCICRGLQVLNVALGGTLIVDIPDALPASSIAHRQPPEQPHGPIPHDVQVSDDSNLARIMQCGTVNIASWHHQAIDTLAPGLEVVARASDGIIEAVEMPESPHLLIIQWHPELTAAEDDSQQRLFDELVGLAKRDALSR